MKKKSMNTREPVLLRQLDPGDPGIPGRPGFLKTSAALGAALVATPALHAALSVPPSNPRDFGQKPITKFLTAFY